MARSMAPSSLFAQTGTIASADVSNGLYTLRFPIPFGSAPVVVASPNAAASGSVTTVGVSGVTTTGCKFQIVRSAANGVITNPDLAIHWIAVGMP